MKITVIILAIACFGCSTRINEEAQKVDKIKVLSVSALLGEAIRRIHDEDSVSSLFV